MKKLLFILLLTLPILGFSQVRTYECNCKENNFRQIFEVDSTNQTIKRISTMNTETGKTYTTQIVFNDMFWKNNFVYFLLDKYNYIGFYRFDFTNNIFILESYGNRKKEFPDFKKSEGEEENVFKQYYNCFWYQKQ